MRGLAALMVLTSHYHSFFLNSDSGIFQFLASGVDLFFVISGYLFAQNILHGMPKIPGYLLRRFFRIYPLYLLSLLMYAAATPSDEDKALYFIRHLFFLQTTRDLDELNFFNSAYWTLPVEVEFYLVVPLLFALHRCHRFALPGLVLLAVAVKALLNLEPLVPPEISLAQLVDHHLPGKFLEFFAGVAVYKSTQSMPAVGRIRRAIALVAGLALLGWLASIWHELRAPGIQESPWLRPTFNILAAASYALLLYGLVSARMPARLASFGLTAGALSYGVYLLHHLPVVVIERFQLPADGGGGYLAATLFTLLLATLCAWLVEYPARQYGRNLARRLSGPDTTDACVEGTLQTNAQKVADK